MFKCQISDVKCQMSNVNKVKLLSEHTSGVPPVIFYIVFLMFSATMLSCFAVCFSAVPFAWEVFNDRVLAPFKNLKLTYTDITF